ncbi:MAG: DUF6660 family protein [Ginsengibacter sp.]
MKQLVSIFMIVVLLVLHMMPCTDDFAATNFQKETITASTSDNIHHQAGECSPFCSCSCCAVVTVLSFQSPIPPTPLKFLSHQIIDRPAKCKKIAIPIWQPPQLV